MSAPLTPPLGGDDLAKALRDAYGQGRAHALGIDGSASTTAAYREKRDAWIRQYMARMPMSDTPTNTAYSPAGRGDWVLVPRELTEAMRRTLHNSVVIRCYIDKREASILNDQGLWGAVLAAAPSPDPAGAGGDLGELARLSEAATSGPWYTVDLPWGNGAWLVAGNPDPHAGIMVCDCQDVNESRPEDGPDATDDAAFIAACVNSARKLVASSQIQTDGEDTLQARNAAWMRVAFADDPTDLPERIARFGEEALELQQALGQSREDAHALADYVYSRPAGAPATEFGQAAGSLACLAEFAGYDLEAAAEAELDRVSTPEFLAKLRAKRATRHGRGPLPGFSAPGASEPKSSQTVDPTLTVEEARQLLDGVRDPVRLAQAYRDRANSIYMAPEARRECLAHCLNIELALRTLQAAGEVR